MVQSAEHGYLAAGGTAADKNLLWIDGIGGGMGSEKTDCLQGVLYLCRERRNAGVPVFHNGDGVAAPGQISQHGAGFVDVLLHPGGTLDEGQGRPEPFRFIPGERYQKLQVKLKASRVGIYDVRTVIHADFFSCGF